MNELAMRSNGSERLVEALCLLNYLLCNSPSNFHAKLLCLQIYHYLGCGWGACKAYDSLEVKHVQLDSMGYLHTAHLPSIGIATLAKQRYEMTLKFFTSSYKDSVEYLAMSYKFGSFSKLEEFMDFRDRLSNSLHYSLTSVEALLLELVSFCWTPTQNMTAYKNMNINPKEDRIAWDDLCDNRDLTVIVNWDPPNDAEPEGDHHLTRAEEVFIQDKELLRLRSLLLRIVSAAVEYCHVHGESTSEPEEKTVLEKIKDHFTNTFTTIRAINYKKHVKRYLVHFLPSRLHATLQYPYETVFSNLTDFVLTLYDVEKSAEKLSQSVVDDIKSVGMMLSKRISEHNKSSDLIWERREVQECIVCCIEVCIIL